MQLHASWKALFALITTVNEAGDRNVAGFTGAMTKLVQPFVLLLAANDKKEIAILHQPHNFGSTLLRPSNKVGCLVGVGPSAIPIMLDHKGALCSIKAIVPPIGDIVGCTTVDNIATLPTPPANVDGDGVAADGGNAAKDDDGVPANGIQNGGRRRRGRRNNAANGDSDSVAATGGYVAAAGGGIAAVGNGAANLTALSCFIPAPFLCNAVLAADSPYPLALIVAARAAREAHVHAHDGEEEFDESDVDAHVELFSLWCLGVHQGKVAETRFSLAPDNSELADWSARLHCKNILPSVAMAGTLPASLEDTAAILRSLAADISHLQGSGESEQAPARAAQLYQSEGRKEKEQGGEMARNQSTPCPQCGVK
jgi:hypothetical protein